jgi:uncharacterized protein (UPF0179 family)
VPLWLIVCLTPLAGQAKYKILKTKQDELSEAAHRGKQAEVDLVELRLEKALVEKEAQAGLHSTTGRLLYIRRRTP